jgi:anaerobic dimethyl sulfoxide reductase subunit B (iron-sulfur subunit)
MPKRCTFSFNPDRCLKCFACEIACLQWHAIAAGTFKIRKVVEETSGAFPAVRRTFLSLTCRHCDPAPCAAVCPTEAIHQSRQDGIVLVESQKCNGCQACLAACPFGVPQFDRAGLMHKCDMCVDRIEQGQPPVCVATCPTQALTWDWLPELSQSDP